MAANEIFTRMNADHIRGLYPEGASPPPRDMQVAIVPLDDLGILLRAAETAGFRGAAANAQDRLSDCYSVARFRYYRPGEWGPEYQDVIPQGFTADTYAELFE